MVMEFNAAQLKGEIVEALKAERWEEALPKLEMWCDRFPDHSRSWLNRGYCLVRLERYSEAVAVLDRCLELDSDLDDSAGMAEKGVGGARRCTLGCRGSCGNQGGRKAPVHLRAVRPALCPVRPPHRRLSRLSPHPTRDAAGLRAQWSTDATKFETSHVAVWRLCRLLSTASSSAW